MPKISALPENTALADDDVAPGVDASTSTTKKNTMARLKEYFQGLTAWITSAMLVEAFFRGRHQANTTNTQPTGLTVQWGWGFMQGDNTNDEETKTVTFPVAFASPPTVIIGGLGIAGSSPTAIGDFVTETGTGPITATASDIVAASFLAQCARSDAVAFTSSQYVGFTWIAIGTV